MGSLGIGDLLLELSVSVAFGRSNGPQSRHVGLGGLVACLIAPPPESRQKRGCEG
jgi:hypothetical protein